MKRNQYAYVQVNLCQNLLFLHQLTHNLTNNYTSPQQIPHTSNLSITGQWQGPEIRTEGHRNNELRGEFSAQIVHAVNQLSLHFNIFRKKFHPLTFIKRVKTKYMSSPMHDR